MANNLMEAMEIKLRKTYIAGEQAKQQRPAATADDAEDEDKKTDKN